MLEAQEPRLPNSVLEAREATESALLQVEGLLGKGIVFETWTQETDALEEAFFDGEGTLGKQLLEYATCTPEMFEVHRAEAKKLLQYTTVSAIRLYLHIHRLQTLGFGSSRSEVVERLSVGTLNKRQRVHDIPITPRVSSLIGLLRIVDARVNASDERVWSLEAPPELPALMVMVRDPFDPRDEETVVALRKIVIKKRAAHIGEIPTILTMSRDVTFLLAHDLAQVGELSSDGAVQEACDVLLVFLERKSVFYQNPDARDFALYHLGMENPDEMQSVLHALDVFKHHDPEWFCEILGVNPQDKTRSQYFGSFLHKALYNTNEIVKKAEGITTLALREQMESLFTMDAHVHTYAGRVSQEGLAEMRRAIEERVRNADTPEGKSQALMAAAIPYTLAAVDAEIRKQLEELREHSYERVYENLVRHLDDIEHPLKSMDYIANMPKYAFADLRVQREFIQRFGYDPSEYESWPNFVQDQCRYIGSDFARKLYAQIPLFDITKPDFSWGNRARIIRRDVNAQAGFFITRPFTYEGQIAEYDMYRLSYDFGGQLYHGRRLRQEFMSFLHPDEAYETRVQTVKKFGGSTAFYLGIGIVEEWLHRNTDGHVSENEDLLEHLAKESDNETVFLTILAHPKGVDIAFALFDTFCERIPLERMLAIMKDAIVDGVEHPALKAFLDRFLKAKPSKNAKYTQAYLGQMKKHFWSSIPHEALSALRKIQKMIREEKTPYTITSTVRIDKIDPLCFRSF